MKIKGRKVSCLLDTGSDLSLIDKVTWNKCHIRGGASIVMVIVVGNGHGDTSSNPGRD